MLKDMSDPVQGKKRATYQDILDAPAGKNAEIINGELHLWPRPHSPHVAVQTELVRRLGPFDPHGGGPGGWTILFEPELQFEDDVLVPDLAGWRSERLPVVPDGHISLVPDWVCEILSKSTERIDRMEKMPIYREAKVTYAWLVDPRLRSIEAYRNSDNRWAQYKGTDRARIEPFDAIDFDLRILWAAIPLPTRAQEEAAEYEAR
jgi:Uma2 family endonuclease